MQAHVEWVGLVLLCAASGLGAQETSYEVRGVAGLPADMRISMARSGKASWHTVPKGGATLGSMLQSVCGSQTPEVQRVLESLVLTFNGGDSLDRGVDEGVAVAMPFCLKVERRVTVTVDRGDTLERLLHEHYGYAGPATLNETFELNNGQSRWASLEEFSRNLQPGQQIVLPYAADRAVFARAPLPVDSAVPPASEHPPPPERSQPCAVPPSPFVTATPSPKAALVASAARPVEPAPRGDTEFSYVRFVSAENARMWCTESAGDSRGRDVALLKQRFDVEDRAAALYRDGTPNLIGVIDTGIGPVDTSPFDRFLRANPWELHGRQGVDDDRPPNGYIDDLYGINLNPGNGNGSVLSYEGVDPDFDHGTKVGTIVLGGQDWLTGWPEGLKPWAQLKIVNFSSATEAHPVDAIYLAKAIRYLLRLDVRVVNMSLENRRQIDGMQQAIGEATRTLFVTAAGNTGADITTQTVYPARDGGALGKLHSVLLTVGAHAPDGSWAGFSNYSRDYVDLLAPGCEVPTLKVDGTPVKESGTSIATAFGSFAAGLLGALGETDGRALKNRLLVSVDADPSLESRVRSSGRLNIVKAISLSTDVIEKTDAERRYVFGRIIDPNELRRFCDDSAKRTQLNGMRKVRPNVDRSGSPHIQFLVETDGDLAAIECPQIDADQSIGPVEVDGQRVGGPTLAEVRDIVLADRRPQVPGL